MFLDIGNTNISYIANTKCTILTKKFIDNIPQFIFREKQVVFASVVPNLSEKLKIETEKLGIFCKEVQIEDINIEICLENKSEIGIDRAINAFMGLQKHGKDCIIIDFGTALTFDVIQNGAYEGGMIFAGIEMAMQNLHTRTAKLPNVKVHDFKTGIGKNTVEALHFGACVGYLGTIRETISFIENFYKKQFKIVFTGGSGLMFYTHFNGALFEENLILEFLQMEYGLSV